MKHILYKANDIPRVCDRKKKIIIVRRNLHLINIGKGNHGN